MIGQKTATPAKPAWPPSGIASDASRIARGASDFLQQHENSRPREEHVALVGEVSGEPLA